MSLSERLAQAAKQRNIETSPAPATSPARAEAAAPRPAPLEITSTPAIGHEATIDLSKDVAVVRVARPARPAPAPKPLPATWERPVVDRIADYARHSASHLQRIPDYSYDTFPGAPAEADATGPATSSSADINLDSWTIADTKTVEDRQAQLESLYDIIAAERRQRGLSDPEPVYDASARALPRRRPAGPRAAKATTSAEAPQRSTTEAAPAERPLAVAETPAASADAPAAAPSVKRPRGPQRQTLRMRMLRAQSQGRIRHTHTCPSCGGTARIDIHDPFRGRIHLSCSACFRMWQETFDAAPREADESAMMRD
jgi:hypothetical protein